MIDFRPTRLGTRFNVNVQPRASRTETVGIHGDALKVRIAAPPVEGAANTAVGALLAAALGVRTSAVSVVHGERGRDKMVRVDGLTLAEMKRRLDGEGGAP